MGVLGEGGGAGLVTGGGGGGVGGFSGCKKVYIGTKISSFDKNIQYIT